MKKIGILTINDYNNYGNRLQNYATQEYLKSIGFNVETIVNRTKYSVDAKKPSLLRRIKNLSKLPFYEVMVKISYKLWNRKKKNELFQIRFENFNRFTNEFIKETNYSISDIDIPKNLTNKYDFFITGSDQVWNPNDHRTSSIDFLFFAEQHKKIAFSPSFGVSMLNQYQESKYKEWLNNFTYLSVREDDGARIIKEITGRDVPVLVDPTLLLDKEKWLSISKEAVSKPIKKYLLTYFLGGVPNKYKDQIDNISRKNNLEVVNLGDINDKKAYSAGPSEFVDYINSCSIFCTDSFHGAVFSIILEKPFLIYEREGISASMYSRINTLLDKFSLQSRKVENMKSLESNVFEIDYSHIPHILEKERNEVFNFLKILRK